MSLWVESRESNGTAYSLPQLRLFVSRERGLWTVPGLISRHYHSLLPIYLAAAVNLFVVAG